MDEMVISYTQAYLSEGLEDFVCVCVYTSVCVYVCMNVEVQR